jgi:hypothetical protein
MTRFVNLLTVLIFALGGASLIAGIVAIGEQRDLQALYWLAMGGLLLKASVEMVRPSRTG